MTITALSSAARRCLGAAALAACVLPTHAAVIVSLTPVPVPDTFGGVYINFLTGMTGSTAAAVPGWDFNPWGDSGALAFFWPATPAGTSGGIAGTASGPYLDLAPGAVISSAATFSTAATAAQAAAFHAGGNHVLGFRFFNEASSTLNYGYALVATNGPTGFPAVITGWVYESTGSALVPEASTTAMLSAGVLVLGALALRRRAAARS